MNSQTGIAKPNPRRERYLAKFPVRTHRGKDNLSRLLDQLDRCKSDDARRLILGVSRKYDS